MHDTRPRKEGAFIVGLRMPRQSESDAARSFEELRGLCDTLGLAVVGAAAVKLREPHGKYLLGEGKAAEIAQEAKGSGADSVIFNSPLTPTQQRNWDELAERPVYDRQELIIKIFASRARTREAVLQTELARLEYSLPRLAHSREDLSRQRGGRYGTKGAGEQKLELDRREIRKRIARIKDELEEVRKDRGTLRKRRDRVPLPSCAIVGYTNAGKSSLLNALTNADVLAESKLFATLDPTTRRLSVGAGGDFLLTDTVGFIRDLPHNLVEAFKATLEEALNADFLLHLLDASDEDFEARYEATRAVLRELKIEEKASLVAFSKSDLVPEPERRAALLARFPEAVFVSVKSGEGVAELAAALRAFGARAELEPGASGGAAEGP